MAAVAGGGKLSLSDLVRELHSIMSAEELADAGTPLDEQDLLDKLVARKSLTKFQADALARGAVHELRIGNYEVLSKLGAGGMGAVYKARHRKMKRIVALKVLAKELVQDPVFVQRFQREVETIARLQHPNIVMAYDADEAEVGHFLVMEFVDGADLTSAHEHGLMPLPDAVRAIADAARGLDYAQREGIVHRDIKPANLLRDRAGAVKIADLGLARLAKERGHSDPGGGLTQAGGILGTIDYMSPEQAIDSSTLTPATDVYSLGGTLYYVVVGSPPFQGGSLMATLMLHREGKIPSLRAKRPEAPARLDALCQRMLAKLPGDRPTMAEAAAELDAIAAAMGLPPADATVALTGAMPPLPRGAGDQSNTIEIKPGSTLAGKPLHVLVVEPSRVQASILKQYIGAIELASVEVAASGAEALAAFDGGRPDAVVSAMHLKDMTGVELARKLREKLGPPPIPDAPGFVLVSSAAEGAAEGALSSTGLGVPLHKPFTAEQLTQALGVAVGRILKAHAVTGSAAGLSGMSLVGKPLSSSLLKKPRELRKVLIVDDSKPARTHARIVLQGLGLKHFVEAEDGAQGVAAAAKEPFDLIVTDYNMPFMNGAALVGYLRANPATAKIPIIMVTTETTPDTLDPIRKLGVAGITEKAFPASQVGDILDKLW